MNPRINLAMDAALLVLDAASREVRQAKSLEGHRLTDRQEIGAMRKATAYVFAAAALERACKEALRAVVSEIDATATLPEKLRPSLFALRCAPALDTISVRVRSLENRQKAAEMFETLFSTTLGSFGDALPVDGKTPRRQHFETIWRVFGFPLPALPSPSCGLALEDLANGRNAVAHGGTDPITFGKSKPWSDVDQRVKRAEDVVVHLFTQADSYLDRQEYLR